MKSKLVAWSCHSIIFFSVGHNVSSGRLGITYDICWRKGIGVGGQVCLSSWRDYYFPPFNFFQPHATNLCYWLGSHQPISACSFVYKACQMDSNTWKKTPGARKLISLESLFSRWRILMSLQEAENTRKMAIIYEELINLMWSLPHAKLFTAVPFASRSTLYRLRLLHGERMRRTRQKSHLPERAYLQR